MLMHVCRVDAVLAVEAFFDDLRSRWWIEDRHIREALGSCDTEGLSDGDVTSEEEVEVEVFELLRREGMRDKEEREEK